MEGEGHDAARMPPQDGMVATGGPEDEVSHLADRYRNGRRRIRDSRASFGRTASTRANDPTALPATPT